MVGSGKGAYNDSRRWVPAFAPPYNFKSDPIQPPIKNKTKLNQIRERTISRLRAAYKLLIVDGSDVARRNARLEIHALHDLGGFA